MLLMQKEIYLHCIININRVIELAKNFKYFMYSPIVYNILYTLGICVDLEFR